MDDRLCHTLPSRFALTVSRLQEASVNGTAIVTFADVNLATFALNWARLLRMLNLKSLIGIARRTGGQGMTNIDRGLEEEATSARASLFCADGPLMALNGQAGRWAEVLPLLQLARRAQLSVLLSDADIAWMRDPLPYFAAVRSAHPRADVLMMTDRAFNGYSSKPLSVQPQGQTDSIDLELEPGFESSISYNIGVIWFKMESLEQLEGMVARFVVAVGGRLADTTNSAGGKGDSRVRARPHAVKPIATRRGSAGAGGEGKESRAHGLSMLSGRALLGRVLFGDEGWPSERPGRRLGQLSSWDQEPINKEVLQRGLRHDSNDARLVRVDQGRLAMGVLPMLQFTTSFTYYMQQKRRESLRARPYCLHVSFVHCKDEGAAPSSLTLTLTQTLPEVIFAHGKDKERKLSIFREEKLWVDPPSYYDPDGGHGKLLVLDHLPLPEKIRVAGGFDMILTQHQQVHMAFRLAALTNRTLVLPRFRCGERPMAYPCYAWYHRAMAYFGINPDKVPMPEYCPMYYWIDVGRLGAAKVRTQEPL